MAAMKQCETCGADIAVNAKMCPHCGDPNKKPFYRRKLFIACVAIVVIALVICAVRAIGVLMWCSDAMNGQTKILFHDKTFIRVEELLERCAENPKEAESFLDQRAMTVIFVTDIVNDDRIAVIDRNNRVEVAFELFSTEAFMGLHQAEEGSLVLVGGSLAEIDTESGVVVLNRIRDFSVHGNLNN